MERARDRERRGVESVPGSPVRVARMAMPASSDPAYVTSAFALYKAVCIARILTPERPAGE